MRLWIRVQPTSLLAIQMEMTPKWPCSPDKAFNVGSERNFSDFDSGVMNVMVGSPGESQECNMTIYDVTEIVQHMRTHTQNCTPTILWVLDIFLAFGFSNFSLLCFKCVWINI